MADLTTEDLIDQYKTRIPGPVMDTSFTSALQRAGSLAVDDEYSISQYLNEDKLRARNEALDRLVADEFLPLDFQNELNQKYYSLNQMQAYYDAIVEYLNTIPESDRPKPPDGNPEWRTRQQIMQPIFDDLDRRRRELGNMLTYGDGWTLAGALAGSAGVSAGDPVNLGIMAGTVGFGVTRTLTRAGRVISDVEHSVAAAKRLKSLSRFREAMKTAGAEGLIGIAAETAITMENSAWRDMSGNPYTAQDLLIQILSAGGVSAAVGGGVKAITTNRVIKRADAALKNYDATVKAFQEVLSGLRDRSGRLIETSEVQPSSIVVGKANWAQDETAVGVYSEYAPANTNIAFQPRDITQVGNPLRAPEPPTIKKGQKQIPLDAYTTDLFMAFDTQAFARLANENLVYSTVTPESKARFDLFSTAQQATDAVNGTALIRFDPSQIVGYIKYAPKGFRHKTNDAWQRGEAHFLVNKESKFAPEGRKDNFLFDTATHVQFEIPSLANKYAKVLRKQGFIRDPAFPQTGFLRPPRTEVSARDLAVVIDDMTVAMNAYDQGINVFRGVPEDVKALPAETLLNGLQYADRTFMSPTFIPDGQGVSNFRKHTGVDIKSLPPIKAGVQDVAEKLPDDYLEIEQQFNQLMTDTDTPVILRFDESYDRIGNAVQTADAAPVLKSIDADIKSTENALLCLMGGAAGGK